MVAGLITMEQVTNVVAIQEQPLMFLEQLVN